METKPVLGVFAYEQRQLPAQHPSHPVLLGTQGREGQGLELSGCTPSSVSPSSPGTAGTISTADSLLPHRHPWCCPMVPPGQQHLLPHSTLQHTPPITHPARAGLRAPLPCSWAQHPPNTPTASNQSVSLLPSWHCSCHTPSLSPGVWSNQQCRAMAPHNFQEHGDLRGKS